MAAPTGVLPFVRGIDFTRNDFADGKVPKLGELSGARWLRLNRVGIDKMPFDLTELSKLEHISLTRNQLSKLDPKLAELQNLRALVCAHNKLQTKEIPKALFDLGELSVLDFSHNQLNQVPDNLEKAKTVLALNLAYNKLDNIPSQLFVHMSDVFHLDLSNNKLGTIPPQIRRLMNLQTLIVNNNPLFLAHFKQVSVLNQLRTLHMRNTERNLGNIPLGIENLPFLEDVDLSQNKLSRVPESVYKCKALRRLNLSENELTELTPQIENWEVLEVLNLSRNKISEIPAAICKLAFMRRLYLNSNNLDFEGIPKGIGKLHVLEVFSATNNKLEMIPEGLCRCTKLKKLILNQNRLITLPDTIHFLLETLEVFNVEDNPDMMMPPKPPEMVEGSGLEFYNIDFSLSTQLRKAGAAAQSTTSPTHAQKSNPMARKLRLRKKKNEDSDKVLQGMRDVAKDKERGMTPSTDEEVEPLRPKKWNEVLARPDLDYTGIFDEDVGQIPGLSVFEIENFLPNPIEEAFHGKFYEADCYIVLKTSISDSGSLDWEIFYWIGRKATLDKKACSAIHAVNLRNLLGANCRTAREEMDDESDEFLNLFEHEVAYIEGGRTSSGFYSVEDSDFVTRLYRASGTQRVRLVAVSPRGSSLDPGYVFMLDTGTVIYIWMGENAKTMTKSKTRLLADKINKVERKGKTTIKMQAQGIEDDEFWAALKCKPIKTLKARGDPGKDDIPRNILYNVRIGMGYLELPQVEIPQRKLTKKLLDSKNVYILDCFTDVFVWIGKKSSRLIRAAALKLSQEVVRLIKRPEFVLVTRCLEGTELQLFKNKFSGWDDVLAVDYTRTSESVNRRGVDMKKIMSEQMKTDLSALFMKRQPVMDAKEAEELMTEWNEDLDGMESFVLEGKKFVRLPDIEVGHFYSEDCYVFLCRYWVPQELAEGEEEDEDEEQQDDFKCTVYFWQGRNAGNMGWLTFTFSLQKKFESLFADKLEVIRTHQQQENIKFLSHFKRKFVIHQGRRPQSGEEVFDLTEFYQIRSNGGPLTTRCIQIDPDASLLNSHFCYILKIPLEGFDEGIVYVWHGQKAPSDEVKIAQELANEMFGEYHHVNMIDEGEEPENFFWVGVGGKKPYDKDADYLKYARLFRCSNEKGYFTVSEKCSDFCQDDLADDDVMILDTGELIYLWIGKKPSDVEIKLAFKSAQVYNQHLRNKQSERPRKLVLALKGKENRKFTRCFHGWGKHKAVIE